MIMTPEQYPDIWSHIISYLKLTPPPPWKTDAKWSEMYQQDLTVMARVSSTIHELTIPHLYTSVIVDDLSLFLRDVPLPSRGTAPDTKFTSKLGKLALVKNLRLPMLWYETEHDPKWQSSRHSIPLPARVISPPESWDKLRQGASMARRHASGGGFPAMETIILGQALPDAYVRMGWSKETAYWDEMMDLAAACSPCRVCIRHFETDRVEYLARSLFAPNATQCSYSIHGSVPGSMFWFSGFPREIATSVRIFDPPFPLFRLRVRAELNRAEYPNAPILRYPYTDVDRSDLWEVISEEAPSPQAAVELCGVIGDGPEPGRAIANGEPWLEGSCREVSTAECLDWMRKEIGNAMHKSWKGKIKLVGPEETPPCEACGWTTADGW